MLFESTCHCASLVLGIIRFLSRPSHRSRATHSLSQQQNQQGKNGKKDPDRFLPLFLLFYRRKRTTKIDQTTIQSEPCQIYKRFEIHSWWCNLKLIIRCNQVFVWEHFSYVAITAMESSYFIQIQYVSEVLYNSPWLWVFITIIKKREGDDDQPSGLFVLIFPLGSLFLIHCPAGYRRGGRGDFQSFFFFLSQRPLTSEKCASHLPRRPLHQIVITKDQKVPILRIRLHVHVVHITYIV